MQPAFRIFHPPSRPKCSHFRRPVYHCPVTISLIVVNFKSSEPLRELISSAGEADEIVVVDHSENAEEEQRLRCLGIDRLVVAENRGYGAGLNRGARESSGDVLILSNPDVVFEPGAITCLAEHAAQPGIGLAGPQYCWDADCRWLLPQVTDYTWQFELRTRFLPRLSTRRHIQRQIGFWHAKEPVDTSVINGGVTAITRANFTGCGGFDDRFFLFFEENDLCLRLRRMGLRISLHPDARIWHTVGYSIGDGEGNYYRSSLRLFRKRWFPRWYRAIYDQPPEPKWVQPALAEDPVPRPGEVLLLSTNLGFIPAGHHVWRNESWPPRELLPPHAGEIDYHLGVLRDGDLFYLGTISRQAGFLPIARPR